MRSIFLAVLVLTACPSTTTPVEPLNLAEGCQPLLAGADCMLPYPSDFHRVEDATLPTGFRVRMGTAAKMKTTSGLNADAHASFAADGFSPLSTIVALLPVDVSAEGFVHLNDDPEKSLSGATSHTLILDPDGTPVPHFVDLDPRATDPLRRAIVIHPIVPLKDATRYSVFLFGVKTNGGALAPTPEGFRRIRDDATGGEAALSVQLDAWKTRLSPLAKKLSLTTTEIQLAWEFSTGSQENVAGDMLEVRAQTLAWLTTHTPTVTVTSVEDAPADDTWKQIQGTISMPLFTDIPGPKAKLLHDASGKVMQNGESVFPFIAIVPNTVRDATTAKGAFLYGHGFFGGFGELGGGSARHIASGLERTLIGAEWWGMATGDVGVVADGLLNHPSSTMQFTDRVHQGFANWIVLADAVERVFPTLEAFKRTDGTPFIQGDASNYLGISQGTILGVGMAAVNPKVRHVAMEVGGSGFTAMMFRALPFKQFLDFLVMSLPDPLEQQKYIASLQRQFDRVDPNTYSRYLRASPLGGDSQKTVLLQIGLGDAEVPNFASFVLARSLESEVMQPSPTTVWGLSAATASPGSAIELFDFGIDTATQYAVANFPAADNDVHEGIRRLGKTIEQLKRLFDQGTIVHTCEGTCDPE